MELQTAKGTRDFPPEEKILRNRVVDTLKTIFEKYGFSPLETPILERYETLSAKYAGGSEILKETFKLKDQGDRQLGLRYDLTVPMCRFVGMNPTLKMPFKRYQIGRVFRDGPISSDRVREFWSCDVDVVGSKSMIAEAEILSLTLDVFKELKLDIIIKVNNRKLLNGILEQADITRYKDDVILVIDKLEKITEKGVSKELETLGLNNEQINDLLKLLKQKDLKKLKISSQEGQEGLKELEELFDYLKNNKSIEFDPSLARGLAYYTGTVFEVFTKKGQVSSSLAAGGRYDKMIGGFLETEKEYPAMGIAFGLNRICLLLKDKIFKKKTVTDIFIIPISTQKKSFEIANRLRQEGFKIDLDIIGRGISKNLDYANKLGIPYVIFIGEEELSKKSVKIKNMQSGKETTVRISGLAKYLKKELK